jgi:hypothetical protein
VQMLMLKAEPLADLNKRGFVSMGIRSNLIYVSDAEHRPMRRNPEGRWGFWRNRSHF